MTSFIAFIVDVSLRIGAIIAVIGVIFGVMTAVRRKSKRAGMLLFVWSFSGGLLGSLASFFIGRLLAYWIVVSNTDLTNPKLSGLSQGLAAGSMIVLWLIFWLVGAILGAILGGVYGLRFYKSRHGHS